VTWTYTDVNGNASTQTQNVVITDLTAPVADVATLSDVTDECSVTALTAPTATDNCGGTVTVSNDASLPISAQGTTVVTWTYTDVNGNASTQTQNVVITDLTAPVTDVVTLADLTGLCSVDTPTAPTATDNCAGTVNGTTTTVFPVTAIGTTTITWEYSDGNGNITTQTQDVVISGVDVSTSLSGDGAIITANNGAATYQWIDCSDNSLLVGETNQSLSPLANGDYAVIVTEGNCIDTSACVTVSTVGIGTLSITKILVYPNPSLSGYFTISYDGTIEAIEILDILGRTITLPVDLNSGIVDGSELADGRYIIRVKTDNGYALSEIVIAN
ncbi:MAG: T9SS type A sorting domain-containing protein, partial [Crocinitomicaceae bacterium]|nr:T9SS type A sorting domain-containing protein [Crocinitomicaceae bacterium]